MNDLPTSERKYSSSGSKNALASLRNSDWCVCIPLPFLPNNGFGMNVAYSPCFIAYSLTVARLFCDILTPERTPYEGDPRYVLRRALERAQQMGFDHYFVGPELEFFYFRDSTSTQPLDEGGYFDLTTLDAGSDLRRETVLALEQLAIHTEYTHHEVGPSQHEIDMRYADALKMADDCMTYRITLKEYALKYALHATFMPKPLFGKNGSGMHTHQSLFRAG